MNNVGVGRISSATGKLLITSTPHGDRVLHRSLAAGIKRPHVEDIDTLHLSENFETLETSGLLKIGRDGSGLGTRTKQILLSSDFYIGTG